MKTETKFVCSGGAKEEIPIEIQNRTGYRFPNAHCHAAALAGLSQEMKKLRNETVCRLPFCLTVEAEAMGADINIGDMKVGPRAAGYVLSHLEALAALGSIDLDRGRIKAVLDAAEHLSRQGETVALNLEGPFTILSFLIEPKTVYKAIYKDDDRISAGLEKIENNIVAYAQKALQRGVKILSYADPMGAMDLIGPQIYRNHSGRITHRILKKLTAERCRAVIHLCGKTSTALEKTGYCQAVRLHNKENQTYSEQLFNLMDGKKQIHIIGHSCFHQLNWHKRDAPLWDIQLTNASH